MSLKLRSQAACSQQRQALRAFHYSTLAAPCRPSRVRSAHSIVCQQAGGLSQQADGKAIIVKTTSGDMPLPYSDKDPYRLPLSIDRVQRLLFKLGWEKPWIEQIVDRITKNMLKTTEERTQGVIDYLVSIGLRQDEVCNMASISVVLLGLNPETRLKPVVEYLKAQGLPDAAIPDIVLKHPRIFEYKLVDGELTKGKAHIKVDVIPLGPEGEKVCSVNYFREGASFMVSPVSPAGPVMIPK